MATQSSHESIIDRNNENLASILDLVAASIARNVACGTGRAYGEQVRNCLIYK